MIKRRNDHIRGREIASWILAVLVVTSAAACGGQSTTGGATVRGASPAASAASVLEDLSFSGAIAGRMSAGAAGDSYVCASTGGAFVAGPILGMVADKQVELNITKLSFVGAGTYTPGGVSFDVDTSHYYPATGAAGTLVVATDLRSGSVDMDLAVDTDPNTVVAHVSGTWRCPPGGS